MSRLTRRRGNTMVEMAIALPIFLLLVWGVIVIGSIYNHQMAINQAAREAARMSAVGWDYDSILQQVHQLTPNLSHQPDRFQLQLETTAGQVVARVYYKEKVGVPLLSILFNNKMLVARAEHRFETDFFPK